MSGPRRGLDRQTAAIVHEVGRGIDRQVQVIAFSPQFAAIADMDLIDIIADPKPVAIAKACRKGHYPVGLAL